MLRRALPLVLTLSLAAGLGCKGKTSPSAMCSAGPYAYDSNVQRCRASNGQFATDSCCGR
jgi:hypothetical protein